MEDQVTDDVVSGEDEKCWTAIDFEDKLVEGGLTKREAFYTVGEWYKGSEGSLDDIMLLKYGVPIEFEMTVKVLD